MLVPTLNHALEDELLQLKTKLSLQDKIIKKQANEINRLVNDLEKAKSNYSELYQLNTEYYFTVDKDFTILNLNYAAASFLGSVAKFLCGTSLLIYFNEYGQTLFKKNVKTLFATRISRTFDLKLFLKKRGKQYLRWNLHLDSNDNIFINAKELTVTRQLEGTILELKQNLFHNHALLQNCTDAIAILDNNFKFIQFNKSFFQCIKEVFKQDVVEGMSLDRLISQNTEWETQLYPVLANLSANERMQTIIIHRNLKDDKFESRFEFNFCNIINNTGAKEFIVSIKKSLQQDQNGASFELHSPSSILSELTSALAHEINQPLTAIRAYARGCLLRAQKKTDLKEFLFPLEQISMQTTYATAVTQRMKNFMCPDNLHLEISDLNELIKKTTTFLYYDSTIQKLKINFKFASNLPLIKVDQLKIMQVLLNLGHNSIDSFKISKQKDALLSIETALEDEKIVVHFKDNGPGISKQIADKIFTPYFTTKAKGTGLGLAISRSFIKAHGGDLNLCPSTEGSWFYFTLPFSFE